MSFTPSKYQQSIFDYGASNPTQDAVIEALAGSGKTTTLEQLMSVVNGSIVYVAFNKHIADAAQKRVPAHVQASTFHSLMFRALRNALPKVKLEERKIDTILDANLAPYERSLMPLIKRGVALVKATLTPTDNPTILANMLADYGLELNGSEVDVINYIPKALAKSHELTERSGIIDFDDMIYEAVRLNVPTTAYDWIMVDEAQDFNACQQAALIMMRRPTSRIVAVGDKYQSIYGFRGADFYAMDNMVSALGATTLPLSICYRCPTSHLELAQDIVPQIEPAPGAKRGTVNTIAYTHAITNAGLFRPDSMTISRLNAPLVKLAFSLLRNGIPCQMRGRDIGQSINAFIRKASKPDQSMPDFLAAITEYYHHEMDKLAARRASESQVSSLEDKYETVIALSEDHDSILSMTTFIDRLFSDEEKRGLHVLSSVHRAKGLEADTVNILDPNKMPMRSKTAQGAQQERNIKYVALTRSKDILNLIHK